MKKYLITGALSLVACATLTSCHSDEEFNGSYVADKIKTYEQVFKEEFGEVNPNQDWGFGAASQMSRMRAAKTRAISIENAQAGANTEKNLWGDPNQYNLQVPPALTDGQRERVRKYFQTHTPLTYVDPHYENFYIQQVYKGGTSPSNDPIMSVNGTTLTEERYSMADGTTPIGSEHMDYLTVGLDANGNRLHHVNDFNDGEWNNGTKIWVLDEGASTNDWKDYAVDGVTHQDQITLMLHSNTQRVGFANSTGTVQHNYACALVNPKDIDDWANSFNPAIGENVYYNILDDQGNVVIDNQRWQRSFVGLDYESDDPYHYDNGAKVPAKVGDVKNDVKFAKYGNKYYLLDDIKNKTLREFFGLNKDIYLLQNDVSKFAGTRSELSGQSALLATGNAKSKDVIIAGLKSNNYTDTQIAAIDPFNSEMEVLDLDVIKGKIDEKCMPVIGTGLVDWVKDFENRGRDYIYSDWIVTLTKAVAQGTSITTIPVEPGTPGSYTRRTYKKYCFRTDVDQCGRIMCEDLGTSSSSDIDFNDIVFDAYIYNFVPVSKTKVVKIENGVETVLQDWSDEWAVDASLSNLAYSTTDVYLLAGGGTIPVTIAGRSLKEEFNIDTQYLVNTVDDHDPSDIKRYGNPFNNEKGYVRISDLQNINSLNDIEVVVLYQNSPVLLKSDPGRVPQKICVPILTKWPYERVVINEAYDFNDYVKNGSSVNYTGNNRVKIINDNNQTIGFYLDEQTDESRRSVWTKSADDTNKNETASRFHGDYFNDSDITRLPYGNVAHVDGSYTDEVDLGYTDETVTDSGNGTGYHGGDPVLVRRRN